MNNMRNTPPMPKLIKRRKPLKSPIRTNLWVARYERRMTQDEVAKRARIARRTVHNIEVGKSLPTLWVALRIADALDKPVGDIFSLAK